MSRVMKRIEIWWKWLDEGVNTKHEAKECIKHIQSNYNKVGGDVQLKYDRDLRILQQYLRTNNK
jgi:hypothetical protein